LQLGRYRLDEQVGQGGMAVVWRGFDTQLKRPVAVKVLHPHLHGREEIRKRFVREAQAVARLHHPNILDVYDSSDPGSEPSWLVMELIRGTTLRGFADAHAFDPPELAAACLVPLAEALEHAHGGGVIHRDVKPENVMVREDGTLKLTDFGIAAIVEPDEKFTATGQILGSPAHLAPEIIEGKPATPKSDLFSLGTLLYWLSCGQLPFRAPTPAALLRLIMECKPQDPRMVRPSLGDAQAGIIARCLQRDPDRRFASAAELASELTAMLLAAGIEKPREELAAFVRAPEAHGKGLRARLIERSLTRGDEELALRKTSAALAAFGRALSLDPENDRARAQVERIHKRARRARLVRRAALGASLAILVGVGGMRATSMLRERRVEPQPPPPVARIMPPPPARPQPEAATPVEAQPPQDEPEPEPPPAEPPPSRPAPEVKPPPPAPPRPKAIEVTLKPRLPARLIVDGVDRGIEPMFTLSLTAGPHRVVARHECCQDFMTTLDVTPGTTRYPIDLGAPKPALVKVAGAPANAQVSIDGSFIGTVGDLERKPFEMGMSRPFRDVKIKVGDRAGSGRLEAGRETTFDAQKLGGGR